MFFSVVVPLYNRPDELAELLSSLCEQTDKRFEVIVVEDGSVKKGGAVVEDYRKHLDLTYIEQENAGPGAARNRGAEAAKYDYLIFFDSDCVIPPDYIRIVNSRLTHQYADAYGGPDAALPSFTPMQKAINYSMTSFFTSGGIRGGQNSMEKFNPRSFNMGVSLKAFHDIGGYGKMRFGEDIDLSLRLREAGFRTALLTDAFVYHKRRSTLRQFFKQVYNSGIARVNLHLAHPGSLKPVHLLPSLFVIGMVLILMLSLYQPWLLLIPLFYSLFIFADSLSKNGSSKVALYSIAAAWVQPTGYGIGFLVAVWKRLILKQGEFRAFEKKFYN